MKTLRQVRVKGWFDGNGRPTVNRKNKKERQEAPAFEYKRMKLHCASVEEEKETTFRTVKLKF